MNYIKNIIMDIDGTIFTHDKIFPENLAKFMRIHHQFNWILTTGRPLELVLPLPFSSFVSQNLPHVLDGGSRIQFLNETTLVNTPISIKELDSLFTQITEENLNYVYTSTSTKNRILYIKDMSLFNFDTLEEIEVVSKLSDFISWCYHHKPSKIFVSSKYTLNIHDLYILQNECHFDMTHHGIDKGSGLKKLFELYNLKPEESLILFNDFNDVPMVEEPYFSSSLKAKVGDLIPHINANFHIASPFEVVDLLEKVVLNNTNEKI